MGHGALMILIYASAAVAQTLARVSTTPPVPLMRCQQPQATQEALIAHLCGSVIMSLTVGDDGMPNDIQVVNPLGLGLDESAISCMSQSRYSPAQKDGKPIPLKMNVALGFQDRWDSDWHLGKVAFQIPEGASRPVFVKANYPAASGDKRPVTVCIHLTVDRSGVPGEVQLAAAQDPKLDKQALAIVNGFRFKPATKGGKPVDVHTTLNLVHSPK